MTLIESIQSRFDCDPEKFTARKLLAGRRVLVYGAGEGYTALIRTVFSPLIIRPELIVDQRFEHESLYEGIRCIDLTALRQQSSDYLDCAVIVSLGGKDASELVSRSLQKLGFSDIYWAPDIYEFALHHESKEIAEKGTTFFLQNESEIDDAYQSLADDDSRNLFEMLLTRYMTGMPFEIPSAPYDQQYLPLDVHLSKGSGYYVCCGAYDGDSIRKIVNAHGPCDTIFAFEPDEDNFQSLTSYLANMSVHAADTIVCFPCGVYSNTQQLCFTSGQGLSSTIDLEGEMIVQVVSLDQVLYGARVTYITMDVEGAEIKALEGAKGLLKEQIPDLAISVYHYPEHLWQVLHFLKQQQLGYRFYLRNYSGFTYETVLYATTEER